MTGLIGGEGLAYGVTGSVLTSTGAVAVASVLGYDAATVGPAGATGFDQARQLLQAQQMGAGGFPQYFIENYQSVLQPILTRIKTNR